VPNLTVKVSVARFAESPAKDKDEAFELAYPEGAKVGRSHYEIPKGKDYPEPTFTKHEVKNGKLVPIPDPPAPNGGQHKR
jgi:hypothetical protein